MNPVAVTLAGIPTHGSATRGKANVRRKPQVSRRQEDGLVFRRFADQLVKSDIDLAGHPDVTDLKAVGGKTILHQPDLLGADHHLYPVGNDEGRGRRPDMADMAIREIAPLMDMAARDQRRPAAGRPRRTSRSVAGVGVVGHSAPLTPQARDHQAY